MTFGIFFLIFQIVIIGSIIVFSTKEIPVVGDYIKQSADSKIKSTYINVQLIALAGFGILTAVVRNNYLSAFIYSLFIFTLVNELYILLSGAIPLMSSTQTQFKSQISFNSLINGSQAAIAMIISFGAVIGRVNKTDIMILCLFGTFGYTFLQDYLYQKIAILDVGKCLLMNVWGGLYGLTISKIIKNRGQNTKQEINHHLRPFYKHISGFGTILLFFSLPFLNSSPINQTKGSDINSQRTISTTQSQVIIINTFFCLFGSFAGTIIINYKNRLKFQHFSFLTLTGGIMSGVIANLVTYSYLFILFGIGVSIICYFCLEYISPFLEKFGLVDPKQVLSTNVIPGICGGILSSLIINFEIVIPYVEYEEKLSSFPFPNERYGTEQAYYQFIAVIIVIVGSIVYGSFVGMIMNIFTPQVQFQPNNFEVPDEEFPRIFNERVQDLEVDEVDLLIQIN